MPQTLSGVWSMLLDLGVGAAAGIAGGFVRWNNPDRRRLGWCLVWEVPSAALVGSAGYSLGGLFELNEYGRFLSAFVFGYLGQAALHDLAVAVLRHRAGLPPSRRWHAAVKLLATIVGDLRQVLAAELRAGERAAMAAVRVETREVQQELRRQVTTAFGAKTRGLANAWRAQVYPRAGQSLRPAGLVWTKAPTIIDAFERGALIRAGGGHTFLAIPTGFNAARGRRGRGNQGLRVTPAQMVASGQAFLRPFRSGRGFVWCLPLRRGEQTGRRRRTRLIAGGVAEIGTANRKGREAWAQGLLARGMVPMFLLLPQVQLPKRLDVRGAAERGLRRLPGRFVAAWERESGRQAP